MRRQQIEEYFSQAVSQEIKNHRDAVTAHNVAMQKLDRRVGDAEKKIGTVDAASESRCKKLEIELQKLKGLVEAHHQAIKAVGCDLCLHGQHTEKALKSQGEDYVKLRWDIEKQRKEIEDLRSQIREDSRKQASKLRDVAAAAERDDSKVLRQAFEYVDRSLEKGKSAEQVQQELERKLAEAMLRKDDDLHQTESLRSRLFKAERHIEYLIQQTDLLKKSR